jgi:hypothetical protein
MVVNEDDRGGGGPQGGLEDFARVDDRASSPAARDQLIADDAVRLSSIRTGIPPA